TDRPIAQAYVICQPANPGEFATLAAAVPLASRTGLESVALCRSLRTAWERVPARVEADGTRFSVELLPWVTGQYHLVWLDREDLGQKRTLNLKVSPDPAPKVKLECLSLAPKSSSVTPNAILAVRVEATDEFAVRSVSLEYRRKDKDGNYLDE